MTRFYQVHQGEGAADAGAGDWEAGSELGRGQCSRQRTDL